MQRIGKDQLVPRESLGSVDALDRKPVAVTVEEALPEQAVAGTRVDVWVAMPDARNGFSRAEAAAPGRGNRAGLARIHRAGLLEVHGPDGPGGRRARCRHCSGAQANEAKISVVWNPGGGTK